MFALKETPEIDVVRCFVSPATLCRKLYDSEKVLSQLSLLGRDRLMIHIGMLLILDAYLKR